MAATDAKPIPRKGIAHRVYFPILDADGDLVTDAAGLLGLVSTDAAAFATVASAPTQVSVSSGVYFCDLSTTEMNGDGVCLKVSSTTSGAKTTVIVLYPQENEDIKVSVTHWGSSPILSVGVAGTPKVDVTHWISTAAATPTVAGVPEVDVTHWNGTVVGSTTVRANVVQVDNAPITSPAVTGVLNVNVTHAGGTAWGSGAITAASIATNAIDDDALAADAVTAIQSGLATSASLNSVNADVVAIKTKTDSLTFTVAGKVDANATHISGASESADRLERSTLAIVLGTVGTSSTTTAIKFSALDPASAVNDQFVGRIITFDKDTTTTALRGQATDITDFVHATQIATVTALTTAPANGDTCTIT